MSKIISDRIRIARTHAGLTQAQLAERMKANWQQVSRWERGEAEPRAKALRGLATALEINLEWLRTGEGEMMPPLDARALEEELRASAAERSIPYSQEPLDRTSLLLALTVVLEEGQGHPPEELAAVTLSAYDQALKDKSLDRLRKKIRMWFS